MTNRGLRAAGAGFPVEGRGIPVGPPSWSLTWQTATDWDGAQSEDGVVHEAVTNTDHDDDTVVKQGYSVAAPYLSANLIHYWPMHEDSGTTMYDQAGMVDGTITGATVNSPGVLGTTAYNFDGVDDEVALGTTAIAGGDVFTLTCWVRIETLDTDDDVVIGHDRAGHPYYLYWNDDADRTLQVFDGASGHAIDSTLTTDTWYFLALANDGPNDTVDAWVDANQKLNGAAIAISNETSNNFIGSVSGGGRYFDGDICEMSVYDKILTSAEVQTLYDIAVARSSLLTASKTPA